MGTRALVVGILNCTPDSFHDRGRHAGMSDLVDRGLQMAEDGADWIDIGGESTRPDADPVSEAEELGRVLPVIQALSRELPASVRISIDTMKPRVAARALGAGASIINDVTGLADLEMAAVTADAWGAVVMHMRGTPRTMRDLTDYGDLVTEVRDHLALRAGRARCSRIWIDPGLGFAKTAEQSLLLIKHTAELVATGYPVLVGASRKSFIGRALGLADSDDRLVGSLAAAAAGFAGGARAFRVHDVKPTRQLLDLLHAVEDAGGPA